MALDPIGDDESSPIGNDVSFVQRPSVTKHVDEVIHSAREELQHLIEQRAEINQRIFQVRHILTGLCSMFGEVTPEDEVPTRKLRAFRPIGTLGLTESCRAILKDAEIPLTAREIVTSIAQRFDHVVSQHKNPVASATTVLSRLAKYGEVKALLRADGRRVWQWHSDPDIKP